MEEGLIVRGRVENDSRQPFKSVKEAVMLFGEKVLAGEIYAHKLKEMENIVTENNPHGTKAAIGDKKQALSSKDEGNLMAYYLMSLKQQLEETKSELDQLKSTRGPDPSHYMPIDPEIEEIKFIDQNPKPTHVMPTIDKSEPGYDNIFELKQADSVKFQTPTPTNVIVEAPKVQDKGSSSFKIKKNKKKTLVPLLSGIFSKSRG
ncbi:hypothetical protein L1987_34118 [Smallanthus sonchifolius]|uniref:Uncharacterized protein n=1 Tax=Smallanthus sonchifolius TaxID=185202 RepID=A0ACB9HUF4_9ASTR|nr:hypothetical protein L1987_34118 [Smallanthus sonchifolius]